VWDFLRERKLKRDFQRLTSSLQKAADVSRAWLAWHLQSDQLAVEIMDQLIPDGVFTELKAVEHPDERQLRVRKTAQIYLKQNPMFTQLIVSTIAFRIAYFNSAGIARRVEILSNAWVLRDYAQRTPPITDVKAYARLVDDFSARVQKQMAVLARMNRLIQGP